MEAVEAVDSADGVMVRSRGLTKRYGRRDAVTNLDLDVPQGAIFALIGPSGCGKTTTVRLLTGIARPTAGAVQVFGIPPDTFGAAERRRLGYMPQLPALYPELSIVENLHFVASIWGMGLRRRKRFAEVLDLVELGDDRRKLLRDASGGMQRRASLAATLLHDPELVFLDEPTAGIDPVLRRKFWDHFAALQAQGRTLVVTTQYVGEAAYCDIVAVLASGRLVAVDTPGGLRRRAYGGDLLDVVAAAPLADPVVNQLELQPRVRRVERTRNDGRGVRLLVEDGEGDQRPLRAWLEERGVALEVLQQHVPSFDDVFVRLVSADRAPEN